MADHEIPLPGKKRDEALALAMGWEQSKLDSNYWCSPSSIVCKPVPAWSTDPALLPELLAECDKRGWETALTTCLDMQTGPEVSMTVYLLRHSGGPQVTAHADTRSAALTEAMCRAAASPEGLRAAEQEASRE